MSARLFDVFLAIVVLALTAAGFVIAQFALALWVLAGLVAVATLAVWLWERRRQIPPPHSGIQTRDFSPVVVGDGNTVTVAHHAPIAPSRNLRMDELIDLRLGEGVGLIGRLKERLQATAIRDLQIAIRDWQKLCVASVKEADPDSAAMFESMAGGNYQPTWGEDAWLRESGSGRWKELSEARIERWMAALRHFHSAVSR
jgi:hypothetical protein